MSSAWTTGRGPRSPAIAELETRGIDYTRAVQGEHTVQIWIVDPAGNTIELQQETRNRARR